jgi:preprotein translocase subunit SecA
MKPKVEKLVSAQRALATTMLAEAKNCLLPKDGDKGKTRKRKVNFCFAAIRGLPKNKALIKFLSEPGMKTILQKNRKLLYAGAK